MKKKTMIIATCIFVAFGLQAFAQGIIVPEPPRRLPHPPQLPPPVVKSQSVEVRIEGSAAVTTIDQVFLNKWGQPLEGTYIFPLPHGATVSDFALWIDGKKVKGELLNREEAARIYRDIVRRMKDPALLELSGFNLFKAHVFPIPPGGERRIELKYAETLKANAGLVRYTYPLKGRGKTYEVPIGSFSIAAKINAGSSITSVYSPTHRVEADRKDSSATVSFEGTNFSPDKDFQLYYTVSEKEFGLSLATWREAGVDDGYYMMMLAPKADMESNAAAKDIVFVLDTSGSMRDNDKIDQALSALSFGLKGLRSEDRFGLITFAYEVKPFREQLLAASKENVSAAVEHLKGISATGATNIYEALQSAFALIGKDSERPRYIVFLTDGLPTHVERDPNVIIKKAKEWAPDGVRLFSWGVGFDVDTRLLDTISADNGGVSEYVKPSEEMELKLGQFFEKISHPVLTDLQLTATGITLKDRYPRNVPDLFKGSQLVLFGRYTGSGKGSITLSGSVEGRRREFTYPFEIKPLEDGTFIGHLWATRKVGDMLQQIRLHGESKELKDEVVRLAKKYGLVTPYTSYLVTEPGADDLRSLNFADRNRRPRGAPMEVEVQVEISPETGEVIRRDKVKPTTANAPVSDSGEKAVQYSKKVRELKEEEQVGGTASNVKVIAGKTFVLKQGVWIDESYSEGMKSVSVEFNSDKYFKLLDLHADMAKWLSIGTKVVIVHDGVAYKITSE